MVQKMSKMVRKVSRKMIWGSREVRKGQNCVADPLEAFPDSPNPLKNKKKCKNVENVENACFPYFSYSPVWSLVRLFSLFGVTRCGHSFSPHC